MRTLLLLTLVLAAPLSAQQFETPDSVGGGLRGVRLGLFGFSAKGGADFKGNGHAVVGMGLDIGDLFTSQVRMRPSFEIGMPADTVNYLANFELMYRFTPDSDIAVPYVLFGLGVFGHQRTCGVDPNCPAVLAQFGLGFELKVNEHLNWLLEYHGEDALRRHRLFIGLSSRRVN